MYFVIIADRTDKRGSLYESRLEVIDNLFYEEALDIIHDRRCEFPRCVSLRVVDGSDMGTLDQIRGTLDEEEETP